MKKSIIVFLLLTLMGIGGCSDVNTAFTDGYSKNPNDPSDSPPEELFIGAQVATIQFFEGGASRIGNMWAQTLTGASKQYTGFNNYNISANDFDDIFSLPYVTIRSNLKLVEDKTIKQNYIAVSKIISSMVTGAVTALWGNIPYSEANNDSISNPHYEKQRQVYTDIQQELTDAISVINDNTKNLPSEADIYSYGGNIDKWKKAAYTLKARFYMHVGNYDDAIKSAKNGIKDLQGNDDLKALHGEVINGNANVYNDFLTGVRVGYLDASQNSAYPLMQKRSKNDPKTNETGRQDFYYTQNGKDLNLNKFFARDSSFPLITAVENELILAESYARENKSQLALKYLNKARKYNGNKFSKSTYKDLSISDFQSGGIYTDTTILQQIFNEEYLSLIFQVEEFNFVRRINYKVTDLNPVKGKSKFPERFLYPQKELNSNDNAPQQKINALFSPTPVNKNQ